MAKDNREPQSTARSPNEDQSRHHYLFEQNPIPMFVYETSDLKILAVNEAFVAKYGYSRAEAVNLRLTDMYAEHRRGLVAEAVSTLGESATTGELQHRTKDGSQLVALKHSRGIVYEGHPARIVVVTDITERKRAEEAVRESERRLRRAESVAHMGSLDWDLKTDRILLSEEACRIFGIGQDEQLVPRELVTRAVHPDDAALVKKERELAVRGEKAFDIDYRLLLPDGTVRWVHGHAKLQPDSDGEAKRILGTVVDITERQQAVEALHESEEQYQKLVRLLPDALFVNVDGRIMFANSACCRLLGVADASELIGKSIFDFVHPDYHDIVRDRRRTTLAGGSTPLEERKYVRLDGSVVDVEVAASGIEWRGARGTQVIVRDITERKQTEGALRESQERYRKLFEDHTAAKLVFDAETSAIVDANDAAVRFYGWTREQLKTMTILDMNVLPPDQVRTMIAKTASEGEGHFELRHRRADGSIRDVEVLTSIIEIDEKRVLESIIHDITERKQAESALRESEERYRELVTFLSDAVYIHVDSHLAFVNEAMCRLLGADDPSLLLGKSIFEVIHPDFHEVVRRRLSSVFKGLPAPVIDEKFIRLDGTSVDVEVSAAAVEWQSARGVQVVVRDITERKKAEAEIRRLNRIYTVLSNVNQAIVRIDDMQRLFSETCRITVEDGGFVMAWLGNVNPESQKVEVLGSFGVTGDYLCNINIDLKDAKARKGPAGRAILSGTHVISGNIEHDDSMLPWRDAAARMGYRSSAAFPIKLSGSVWGVFSLYSSDEPGFFNADEIKLLNELAMNISFAIEFMEKESERKRADDALRKSEELLRTSVRVANIGIYEHDHVNNSVFSSPLQREIYGFGPDEPVTFEAFLRRTHPEDAERVASSIRDAHDPSGDGLWNIEYRIVRGDGTVRWILGLAETSFEGDGDDRQPVRTVGAVLDITERKEAEERLQLSDQIINRVNSLILIADADGSITYVSPSVKSILGYEQEEVLGDGWWRTVYPEDLGAPIRRSVAAAARGEVSVAETPQETEVRSKDGKVHWFFWQDARGPKREIIGVAQDITERKRAEEALTFSERKYRDIFELAPMGIYQITLDGKFMTCNREMARILGYDSPEEMCGVDIAGGGHVERGLRSSLAARVNAQGAIFDEEIPWKKRDGTPVWVQVNARSIKDESGRTLRFEGLVRDITEQKLAEEKLKQNEARRRELERSLLQAQKLEGLGTLASGVAHDFNNLLGVIIGHASLLKDHLSGSSTMSNKSLDAILNASTRGAGLVDQMLTFAKKTDVLIESVRLNDVVNEIVRFIRETFSKAILVETHLAPDLPSVDADSTQVHQVLLNLCVNARDAMPEGGKLAITTRAQDGIRGPDKYPNATAERYVVLGVQDTGTGMDEETQGRIFEPFFTTKEHGKGTGLGLSLVFGIMQGHKGFVTFRTEPGKGTTFECYFPVPTGPAEPAKLADEKPKSIPAGSETVLVVEDEEPLRTLLSQILTSKGYVVLLAEDGERALAAYQKHRSEIALVLSDLGLPKVGGDKLYMKLKEEDSDVRVILASGYVEPGVRGRLLDEGVKEVIQKPYSLDEVLRTVRRVLDVK